MQHTFNNITTILYFMKLKKYGKTAVKKYLCPQSGEETTI